MNPKDQLKQHRSIRSFTDEPVSEGSLSEILECAARASAGGSMQLYSVIVTVDSARRDTLAAIHLGSEPSETRQSSSLFRVDCHRLGRWLKLHGEAAGLDYTWGFGIGFSDALLAAQNPLTAAECDGFGGCFLGSTFAAAPALAGFFECPPHVVPVATLVLGHPAEALKLGTHLPVEAFVHRERYADTPAAELRAMYETSKACKRHTPQSDSVRLDERSKRCCSCGCAGKLVAVFREAPHHALKRFAHLARRAAIEK